MRFLLLLITALVANCVEAQAQDMVTVERWRLEKACQELVLLDSLKKDYQVKDSIISDYKSLDATRLSEITNLKGLITEKDLQIGMHRDMSNSLINENLIWKGQVKSYRRQRNVVIAVTAVVTGLLFVR